MIDLDSIVGFEWDKGNIDKNKLRHGVHSNECEEIFLDEKVTISDDIIHSRIEQRYVAIGITKEKKILFVVFTVRSLYIRVISARIADKKEKQIYEKK